MESVFFQLHVMASVGDSSVTLLSTFRRTWPTAKPLLQRDFKNSSAQLSPWPKSQKKPYDSATFTTH